MKNILIICNIIFLLVGNVLFSNIHYLNEHDHENHENHENHECQECINLNNSHNYISDVNEVKFLKNINFASFFLCSNQDEGLFRQQSLI